MNRLITSASIIAALVLTLTGCFAESVSSTPAGSRTCQVAAALFDDTLQTDPVATAAALATVAPDELQDAVATLTAPVEEPQDAARYASDLASLQDWAVGACGVQISTPGVDDGQALLTDFPMVVGAEDGAPAAVVTGAPGLASAISLCEQALNQLAADSPGLIVRVLDAYSIELAHGSASGGCELTPGFGA